MMGVLNAIVRFIFWEVVIRFIVMVVLGVNIRRREQLPKKGPAIIVPNHNSHLDTMVLMSLYSYGMKKQLNPGAAADHFLRNKWLKWFALEIIGIAPVERKLVRGQHPLRHCQAALDKGNILILYPEGSRGEPEHMTRLKMGIAHLAKANPDVPVIPVFMHGLGKALPKDDCLLVPFFCDGFVGKGMKWGGDKEAFINELEGQFEKLSGEKQFADWE